MTRQLAPILWVCILICAAAMGCGSSDEPGVDPEQTRLFEAYVDAFIGARAESDDAGVALSVIGPNGVIFEKAYGMANIAESLPMTLETPTELASVSKQFTAMAALILHESGKLDLADPISVAFPEAPAAWDGVTFHHLLTHQSGIAERYPVGSTNEEILAWVLDQPLGFAAGTQFAYSNTGYVLLAIAIERLSGGAFESFVAEQIFIPLAMEHSSIPGSSALEVAGRAVSYRDGNVLFDGIIPSTGAAGQVSSIEDLKKWEAELRARTLVSEESYELMFTRHAQRVVNWGDCGYGYGWNICEVEGWPTDHEHTGEKLGYHTAIVRIAEEQFAIVMVSNGDYLWAYDLVFEQLVNLYLSGEPQSELAP